MRAITVRNLPPELARVIRQKAKREKVSLNRAVVGLLEEATGLGKSAKAEVLHHDLDHLAGVWSQEEYAEVVAAVKEQRQIEREMLR